MSAPRDAVAERRIALVAQSDANRAALAAVFSGLESRFALAETVVAAARRIHHHRVLIGAVVVGSILAPRSFRRWIRRAIGVVPLLIDAYRVLTGRR